MADLNATQQAFVDRYAPYANLASQQLGLPSRVILAKLAVETGYGQHFANNNLPGLKTGNSAQNDGFGSARTATWEDYGGSGRTNIKDGFIRYPTPEQSIGGLVPWLSNSTYMNSLADRQGGGIFDRDAAAEASAVQALGSSGFSTDRNASAKVTDVLGRLPDLSSYGIAPSFSPAVNQLMNYVPYDASGQPNVSDGLGGFTNNDYYSGTEFQPGGGVVLPRERGKTGFELPSPTMGNPMESPGLLDTLANGASAVGRGLTDLFGGGSSNTGPAPGDYDFANGANVGGNPGLGLFGSGVSPQAPTDTGFAGGFNPSQGVGNGMAGGLPPGFNAQAYLAANPDVAAAGLDPVQHFQQYGQFDVRALAPGEAASVHAAPGAISPYGQPATTPTFGSGSTASTIGAPTAISSLPPGFNAQAYLAANPDVAASGQDAASHYINWGQFDVRALAPGDEARVHAAPGAISPYGAPVGSPTFGATTTPTLGSGSTASTIGAPNAISGLPPGFNEQAYLQANPDVAASGQSGADHFLRWGQYDVRALAPGQEASVHAAPGTISPYGGTVQASTLGPFGTTPTIGPDGGVSVMSPGLTPTQGPGATVQSFSPGGGNDYLTMPSTTATTQGPPAATNGLPAFFSPVDYIQANGDLAGMSNQQAIDHYLNYGQYETRALAPWLQASVHSAPGTTPTIGAGNPVSTIGAPSLTPTLDTATLAQTLGPPNLTTTLGPPATTNTIGAPSLTPTLGTGFTQPSWSPGGGISDPLGFSGANVGGGLGATSQSFGSLYPLDTNIGTSSGGSPGGGGISDFGFSGADVSGFDLNAASPPMEGGGQGGGGGGGTAKGSSSSAAFLQDQARTRAYWESLVKPADLYGNTNTHTTPIVAPVVPNLTLSNLALGRPGGMFSMFAPWG